jgi:hypothetical protein
VTSAWAIDHDIPISELPDVVTKSIMTAHPNAKILKAQKDLTMDGKIQNYDVQIFDGKEQRQVKLDPSGKITKSDD